MGQGKIVDRVWVRDDLGVPVASVGVLDCSDLIHRRHRVRFTEMEADRTRDFVRLVEMPFDIGTVVGCGRVDSVPRRCQMRVAPTEADAQHGDLSIASWACPEIGDKILYVE